MFHFGFPWGIFFKFRALSAITAISFGTTGCRKHEGELFYMITWLHPDRRIVLASGSPRRKELLRNIGVTFEVICGEHFDESAYIAESDLEGSLCRLALAKGKSPADSNPDALVLSADTIVVCGNSVLGKPTDRADAESMLHLLSGKAHRVMTAVSLVCREMSFASSRCVTTAVHFRNLTEGEIQGYLDTDEAWDKAGAYGIQGRAMVFVEKIEGCFYNVVGLPISGTIDLFKAFDARKDHHNVARN